MVFGSSLVLFVIYTAGVLFEGNTCIFNRGGEIQVRARVRPQVTYLAFEFWPFIYLLLHGA